jgi:hypothetical protein
MIFFTICAAANSSAMTEAAGLTKILNIGGHNGEAMLTAERAHIMLRVMLF